MVLRIPLRNFALNNRNSRKLTSNIEILEEIPINNEQTFSEAIYNNNSSSYSRIGQSSKQVREIIDYFNSKQSLRALKNLIPASYLLKKPATNNKRRLILVDKDIASDVMKVLRPHFETYNGHIMEINAGVGLLTEELLKDKMRNLRIYEPDAVFCNHLLKLIKHYKSDARLFMANILALGGILKADSQDFGDRAKTLFDGFSSLNWEKEPVVKLIGALPNDRFILHLMFSVVLQSGLCLYGRPEMFLIFSSEIYKILVSKPTEQHNEQRLYRSNSVLFQVLFDYEELTTVPEHAFFPWTRSGKEKKQSEETHGRLSLVRISPKKNLLQTLPPDLLRAFGFFVKFLMHKKSNSLIDKTEQWIPGSGVRLISKGYNIYTTSGSLTPEDYLKIYLEFTSWPEFRSSSFLPVVDSMISKILQGSLAEEHLSDKKFDRILNKEDNVSDGDDDADSEIEVDDFDDSTSIDHRDKNVDGRGGS